MLRNLTMSMFTAHLGLIIADVSVASFSQILGLYGPRCGPISAILKLLIELTHLKRTSGCEKVAIDVVS